MTAFVVCAVDELASDYVGVFSRVVCFVAVGRSMAPSGAGAGSGVVRGLAEMIWEYMANSNAVMMGIVSL